MIDAPDDVADHGFRCVVNASHFAELRVVLGEEGFVEVDHRVLAPGPLAEILEDAFDVGLVQKLGQIIDDPGQALVQVRPGNVAENFTQERVGLRKLESRPFAGEGLLRVVVAAGREQTVTDGLRVHVGELVLGQRLDEDRAETLQLGVQRALLAFLVEDVADDGPHQPGHAAHARRQFPGAPDRRHLGFQEGFYQIANLIDAGGTSGIKLGCQPVLAKDVPAEL